ncbi:MAG: hypothetical protein HYY17_08575 [Planctomycetes bacterium]|nr:hypothetical protein [Planctomycetota bacterium]
MKRALLAMAVAGVVLAGCDSTPKNQATKDDIAALKTDLEGKITKLGEDQDRKVKESVFAIEKRLTEGFKDLPEMLATYQKMKNTLEDLTKLKDELEKKVTAIDAKVTTANQSLIVVLEAEEKLLSDRLAEIRRTLEELKKK